VVSGDTAARAKPWPDPLLHAARVLAVRPQDCLYVGDDERDIIAGRAAEMTTVAAGWGYLGEATDPRDWGADHLIQTPAEVLGLIERADAA
jgi:phosphoglycolate phosphatase